MIDIDQHGWRVEAAVARDSGTTGQRPRPGGNCLAHMPVHNLKLVLVDHRAHTVV
ncbi:Uncharacterised protein [Mycobacteroides abscessus subsp. abscessus]|nr:Uncharacterised protein [Mycobacteroides abscessus subsp. abscessus]